MGESESREDLEALHALSGVCRESGRASGPSVPRDEGNDEGNNKGKDKGGGRAKRRDKGRDKGKDSGARRAPGERRGHAQGQGQGHGHGHGHDHSATTTKRLLVAFLITATLLIAEVIGAAWTGSLALLTDAGHMLTDVLGLGVALLAARLMQLPPTPRRTWGFARAEVLSAGVQAGILLFVGLYAAVEGVHRLVDPTDVPPVILLVFGVIGLAGNLATMAVLAGGRNANLNMRAAFLEVVNDALGSVAVIVGAVVIATTGWLQADAIAGLFIAALIVPRALRILREAMSVLLESAPAELDLTDVRAHILSMDHVVDVHDLHVSRIATNMPVLTAHVVVEDACFTNGRSLDVLDTLEDCVASHFSISIRHSTFQLEPARHRDHESDLGH